MSGISEKCELVSAVHELRRSRAVALMKHTFGPESLASMRDKLVADFPDLVADLPEGFLEQLADPENGPEIMMNTIMSFGADFGDFLNSSTFRRDAAGGRPSMPAPQASPANTPGCSSAHFQPLAPGAYVPAKGSVVDYSRWDNFNSSDDEQEPTAQQRDARGPSPSTTGEGGEGGGGKKKKRKTAKKDKLFKGAGFSLTPKEQVAPLAFEPSL